jgi:RHS repeat-associated protein
MKIKYLYVAICCYAVSNVSAQNMPNGLVTPPGSPGSFSQPVPFNVSPNTAPSVYNYIREWTPTSPIIDASSSLFNLGSTNTIHAVTTYTDGFDRTIMTIDHAQDVNSKTIISPVDNRASLTKNQYLPFVQLNTLQRFSDNLNPFVLQDNYYAGSAYNQEKHTALSQSVTSFPSGVPTRTAYVPGASFIGQGRGTTVTMGYNAANEIVDYYFDANVLTGFGTYYAASALVLKTTTEQNGKIIKEYYDKDNRLICKRVFAGNDKSGNPIWLSTNYVYTYFGKIGCILTPKASAFTAMASGLMNYCYTYTYGRYGDVIEKTTPDKTGSEYIVYDNKHRPVLYQSPLLNSQGKWEFTIYDSRDNVIMKGYITDTHDRTTWQDWVYGGTTVTPPSSVTPLLNYFLNSFSGSYPSTMTSCEIRLYNYYDNYSGDPSFAGHTFNNDNASIYLTDAMSVLPVPYLFTQGMLTASRTKVLDPSGIGSFPNTWITTVYFYDQKGHVIQTQTLNPWTNLQWDETSYQYNFSGQQILDITDHHAFNTASKTETKVVTHYYYDKYYNRLQAVDQSIDGSLPRTIATYEYDGLGRIDEKGLGGVEVQKYDYNIRGQLQAINAEHIVTPYVPDESYGEQLSYDYGFSKPRYDGAVSGIVWRGAGYELSGSYGYDYDSAGRLISANYNKYDGVSWNKSTTDYSMSNASYDINGNLLTMNQKGTTTSAGIQTIDQLTYSYNSNSNQLQGVTDAIPTNYGLGDFQDGSTGGTDYSYDADGNLISDNNKGITHITYNELDKPVSVTFSSGNSITYAYDALGNLLAKKVTDVTKPQPSLYRYCGAFNYLNNDLAFILHPEGRARYLLDSGIFKYDYFVKDHWGNVRNVLTTDQGNPADYFAGHELAAASLESSIFANVDAVRDMKPGSTNPYDVEAAHLDGSDPSKRIGTALVLSVMAGDKFDISATSYFDSNASNMQSYADGYSMMNAIVSSLVNGVGGYHQEATNVAAVNNMFSPNNYLGMYEGILDSLTDYSRPRAFINYMVFDNQMNLIPSQCGAVQISGTPNSWQTIGTSGPIPITQNGYVSIYMSDEQFMPVYMDRLNVTYYRGRLVQEQHYYPFGLAINQGTSPGTSNNYLYQGNQLQDDVNLNLSDFHARLYDAQIGRFTSIDPMDQFPSGYTGQGNDPANIIDPNGLWGNVSPGGTQPSTMSTSYTPSGGIDFGWVTNSPHNTTVIALDKDGNIVDVTMAEFVPGAGLGNFVADINSKLRSGEISMRQLSSSNNSGGPGLWVQWAQKINDPYFDVKNNYFVGQETQLTDKWVNVDGISNSSPNYLDFASKTVDGLSNSAIPLTKFGFKQAAKFAPEATEFANGAKIMENIGRGFGFAAVGISLYSGLTNKNGWQTSNTIDVAANAAVLIPIVGEAWGVIWFGANLISYGVNGKSMSDNLGEYIDDHK